MPNEIPKELIEQWSREHMESLNLTDPLEYIAQRAVEWERERLAKLAGEPVAWLREIQVPLNVGTGEALQFEAHKAVSLTHREGSTPLHTQDQTLGAIVRAEDAVRERAHQARLDAHAVYDQRITELESQLAHWKEDALLYHKLLMGFMLDCNAIGTVCAAGNLSRGIKEAIAARKEQA